ncbi:hypothetical protein L9F63_012366 [Diploptera punctata]|uniref:Uncharacterized protein n=1 Tax=Diploptera punctata TaxID=6984 RepID=A0AAD8EP08_DIPPU|nr:hypothetical protein L9F63_012366 [Diploptera punctata]
MSPAISLDEARDALADEPENQDLLTQYTYTTTWRKASQEAALPITKKNVPNSTLENKADPARYVCEETDFIPLGWKKVAFEWDKFQNRMISDPTRAFWEQNARRVKCGACEANRGSTSVDPEMRSRIEELVKSGKIHQFYEEAVPGYAGFIPQLPVGVPLHKRQMASTDPRLSTSQALTKWKEL